MTKIIHPIAGVITLLCITTFWLSTVGSELSGSTAAILAVKTSVPWGFLVLIPALAAAGGSGFSLANGGRGGLIGTKLKRMPFIAANGLLILIPAAFYLASKARAGEFDTGFYLVQALELMAGATNVTLLGLNMRDGFKLTGRLAGANSHDARLTGRDLVAESTVAFRFAKPAGFAYEAGQNVSLTLLGLSGSDARGFSRTLTLASAPSDSELMIATRISGSAFKRALDKLPVGASVRIAGPKGERTLHADASRPAVFLAGGIGITPFLAMSRQAAQAKLPHRITLFYANRQPKDAAFLSELQALENANPNFRLVATMTDPPGAGLSWAGETGHIDEEKVRRLVPDMRSPIYYLAGPPLMTSAMRDMLKKLGVAENEMRCEEFGGY